MLKYGEVMTVFYNNKRLAIIIKGVYIVNLSESTVHESERRYSALSLRIKGNSRFTCNEQEYFLSSGSVAYIPKGVDYVRRSKEPESLITVHLETFGEDESEIQTIDGCENLQPFFETLHELWLAKEYNRCIRTIYKIFDELRLSTDVAAAPPPSSIAPGVEYINRSFCSSDTCIAEAARLCHVSETYFRRIYKSHFGISPVTALLDLRFSYAKSLLRSGYYETKQVASLSGFSDTKYFRTAFKKRFGKTPVEYAAEHSDK